MQIIKDLLNFLFPRFCLSCDERLSVQEKYLCLSCLAGIPRTNFHLAEHSSIEQLFWGRLPVERASCFFFYNARNVRNVIWAFKYQTLPDVARYLAEVYACEIMSSGFFDGIDAIVPVPLARGKYLRRGYNQCEYIAEGISKKTGIPVIRNAVKRIMDTVTQTHLDKQARQENVKGVFKVVSSDMIHGKHILIVDDVLTTGATICSLGMALAEAGGVRISVLALALAGELKGMPYSE